jgi:hypothetical protein
VPWASPVDSASRLIVLGQLRRFGVCDYLQREAVGPERTVPTNLIAIRTATCSAVRESVGVNGLMNAIPKRPRACVQEKRQCGCYEHGADCRPQVWEAGQVSEPGVAVLVSPGISPGSDAGGR